jgi:hypothetical protein
MPRRKPASGKQKKTKLQDSRAIKRGDLEPVPAPKRPATRPNKTASARHAQPASSNDTRLHSKFTGLSSAYLSATKLLAYSTPLERPIPASSAIFDPFVIENESSRLTCPTRPKWVGKSKKEVERDEEGFFRKWQASTQSVVDDWRSAGPSTVTSDGDGEGDDEAAAGSAAKKWPRSPTWYETNLEVWRQLSVVCLSSQRAS